MVDVTMCCASHHHVLYKERRAALATTDQVLDHLKEARDLISSRPSDGAHINLFKTVPE